jgi:hypothetical protein
MRNGFSSSWRPAALALAGLLAVLPLACGGPKGPGGNCETSGDCEQGTVCVYPGTCTEECVSMGQDGNVCPLAGDHTCQTVTGLLCDPGVQCASAVVCE